VPAVARGIAILRERTAVRRPCHRPRDRVATTCLHSQRCLPQCGRLSSILVVALACADSPSRVHPGITRHFPALISAMCSCIAAFGDHPQPDIRERVWRLLKHALISGLLACHAGKMGDAR
jgi:hypothetical protein